MSTLPKHGPQYTVADYQQWQGDWELWQGIPVAMTPSPFGRHQRCSLRLARSLLTAIEAEQCTAEVLQEIDWIVSEHTVVRPDVVVVCGSTPEQHVTEPPALVAEILSPATIDRDRIDKLRLYEENGVDYYLIVDPKENTLSAYARNAGDKLVPVEPAESFTLTICEDCRIGLDVATVF